MQKKIENEQKQKEKFDEIKKNVQKEIFNKKQEIRNKLIQTQFENLKKIKNEEEKILHKQIKEAEEKKENEEKIKKMRFEKLKNEMLENREKKKNKIYI